MTTMEGAAGSADREMDIIRDSLEFKINALKQTWVGTLTEIADRSSIGNLVDGFTKASEVIGSLISNLGLLKTAIIGISGVIGSQKLGLFNYDKTNGFQIGGYGLSELFKNQNAEILKQDTSKDFISQLSETWDTDALNSEGIKSLADGVDGLDNSLVQCMADAKENGLTISEATESFEKQGSTVTKLSGIFNNLGNVGGQAIATIGNALVSAGISLVISYIIQGIQNVITSYDQLIAKVGEITQEYTSARDTVDDYAAKLVNIRTKLEDESTTTEEAAQMTAELYNIQSDLISTYGSYAAGIDLVNGKLEDQIGILQEINKQNLQQWENEVNSERSNASKAINYGTNVFWGAVNPITSIKKGVTSFTDWLGGKSMKEVSSDFAFGEDWLGIDNGTAILGNNLQQISKKYEDFQDVINATDNSKINEIIDSFEEFEVIDGKIKVKGSVDEVSDAVIRLQTELSNIGYKNDALNQDLVELSKNARSVVESSGETYDTNIFNQIMHSDELAEKYMELTQAYNDYKSAQQTGDIEKAEEALDTYLTKLGDIENSNIEQKYKTYFENMHDDLQAEVNSWKIEFEVAPKIEDTDLESYIFGNSYEEIMSDFQKWGQGVDLPDNVENYFETLQKYADDTGVDILQLIQYLQQLDGFDYAKATGMLKKASSGGNGLSTELQQAAQAYYDAVAQYEKVGADKSTFNSGNVELGQNYDLTTASYSGEGYEIVYTPYVYNPDTGKKETLTTKEINDYIGNIIKEATDEETGEIDFDMVMKLDQKGVYNDSTGHVMQNLFMQAGNLGGASVSNYQAEAKAINDRIVAFRDLYNAANDANMSVEEVKASFSNGLNWDDEQIASFLNSLSEDELNAFLTLDLDDVSKVETEEELRQMIDEAQKIADDNAIEIKTKYSESIDALDAMEDAFGGLDTVYETTVTNKEIASASDIEQVNSDMGGTTFNEQDPSNINGLSNAIEAYNQALVENAGDSDAAQDAANKLATAYVDQTNVLDSLTSDLDGVTDEQKNYIIEQLEANGITNAAEVVESRLNKRYKATATSLKSLSKYITQNRKAYDEAIESQDENSETLVDMTENLQDLLSLYNEEGDAVITPELDSSFIIDNADKIEKAISGDVDALAELRVEAAKKIYADVEVFDDNFWADCMSIADEISTLDSSDFTIDGYMNNSDIIAKLNAVKAKCDETGQEFASVLSYITGGAVTAEYEFEHVSLAGQNGAASEAKATILKSVKYKWNGSSSGSSVNYGGGGSSSSSSSGGGSDSGSDSEDSSETFDWVEVQIDRIEEQLDRLDEAVNNTYSNWESRNKNLRKEIELTNTEISKQTKAAQIYEDKANAVDWGSTDSATKSKYIEKIKNGEIIDVNSIEEITNNDDLTEAISEYQDYWQKHIDALDTATTLGITVKEYYKQLFENIESEYDDLITNIEKKNDIIEERITRTEEHGYFVDQKYYDEELKLEKQNEEKLLAERGKLIYALNEAVNKGKIEYASEAWNEMYQSIMDVNKALEESYTNTVKLNNAIRQLKWDAFDWIEDRISDISAEADFLIGLLQGELNYEDNGQFNNRGFAQAGLIGAKYDETLAKAQRYKDEILEVNKLLANDKNDKELIERKEELVQAYRDAISAAEDEKQAMKSLVEEAFNIKVSYLVISRK